MNLTRELILTEPKSNNHFSKIASNYKELRTTDADHIKHIKNLLEKESEIDIADVGCGYAELLNYFSENNMIFEYEGYDINKQMINIEVLLVSFMVFSLLFKHVVSSAIFNREPIYI